MDVESRVCETASGTSMKNLETGKDKIQKICDAIRKETLDPAKQEAREIVENAHLQAAEIVKEARSSSALLKHTAEVEIEERKKVFQSSLQLACKQGIETLKQKIEQELFNPELESLIKKETGKPDLITRLIQGFMHSLDKHGIEEDFEAVIPKDISARSINALLSEKILERLRNRTVEVGDFHGGVQLRMKGREITIDISDAAIRELISSYVRRDFRDMIFSL